MKTKCMGARCIGANHDICQDETLYITKENYSLIAVSDGAGSKRNSHIGAGKVLSALERYFDRFDFSRMDSEEDVEKSKEAYKAISGEIKSDLLYLMKSAIHTEAWRHDLPDNDYACTLVFVLCAGGSYITGHIGDGGIVSLKSDNMEVVSLPENGEYKNVTFFVTDADAEEHFRVAAGRLETERKSFLVCTDGIGDLLFKEADGIIQISEVSKKLCEWLISTESDKEVMEVGMAYEANLKNAFSKKSKDDLSFCVMAIE